MATTDTNNRPSPWLTRIFWIVVILLALMFLLRLFGIKPVDKSVQEGIIHKPHRVE